MSGLLSPLLKKKRLRIVAPYVRGDVLDVGCGPVAMLALRGAAITSYTGVEQNTARVQKLRRDFAHHTFLERDLDEQPLNTGRQFDVVLLVAVIEHIYNQKRLFQELVAALKPAGEIVITTPTPFGNDVVHRLGAGLGLFSKSARDDHIVIYNRKRFEIVARDFDLQIVKYQRFQFGCNQLVVFRKR